MKRYFIVNYFIISSLDSLKFFLKIEYNVMNKTKKSKKSLNVPSKSDHL